MDDKYGSIKRMQEAFNQPKQRKDSIESLTAEAKQLDIDEINKTMIDMVHKFTLDDAINRIICELKNGKNEDSYHEIWKSNISMAFLNSYEKYMQNAYGDDQIIDRFVIIGIANNAAENFLNHLCNQKLTKPQQ